MTVSVKRNSRTNIRMWIGFLFFVPAIPAFFFVAYDLKYPNRFVGDMYAMEIMFKLVVLGAVAVSMLLGAALLAMGYRRGIRRSRILGAGLVVVSSAIMIAMAVDVIHSRHLNRIHAGYHNESVEELLKIARDQKDQHAIDALMTRADPASVSGLSLILLSENEPGNLRYAAAQALSWIGGEDARIALEKARKNSQDAYFREFLDQVIRDMVLRR